MVSKKQKYTQTQREKDVPRNSIKKCNAIPSTT